MARLLEEGERQSIKWAEAVEAAVKFGWIDGLVRPKDDHRYAQRWTPRRPKSRWSKINREIALRHIASGEMPPRGLAAVEAGKASGEWDRTYTVAPPLPVPEDLKAPAEGEPGGEGAAAAGVEDTLESLARVARGNGGADTLAAAEHDRRGARDEGLRRGRKGCRLRRCRSTYHLDAQWPSASSGSTSDWTNVPTGVWEFQDETSSLNVNDTG